MNNNKKKILIISPNATHPPFGGNLKCILSYSEMLISEGYNVYFLWVADFNSTKEEEESTYKFWKEKLTIFKLNQFHRIIKGLFRYFRFGIKGYYKVDDFHPYGIKKVLVRLQKKERFDCIIVNYIFLSKVFKFIKDPKKILFTHDVFTNRFQLTGNPWFSVTASEEAKALNRADNILAIQENEAIFYSYLTSRKVSASYSYFKVNTTPYSGSNSLLFLGGKSPHNIEAITTFIETIFRLLIPLNKGIKLIIGGPICDVIRHTYKSDWIEYVGEIANLNDFYSLGDFFINPTLSGTGLKIKTFEAMSYGKVVLSHPHNVEGIYRKTQAPIIIAQSADDYINIIGSLFGNKEKVVEMKGESIKYINELNCIVKSRFIDAIEN